MSALSPLSIITQDLIHAFDAARIGFSASGSCIQIPAAANASIFRTTKK